MVISPGTYVRGFPVTSLRDWGWVGDGIVPTRSLRDPTKANTPRVGYTRRLALAGRKWLPSEPRRNAPIKSRVNWPGEPAHNSVRNMPRQGKSETSERRLGALRTSRERSAYLSRRSGRRTVLGLCAQAERLLHAAPCREGSCPASAKCSSVELSSCRPSVR